MNTIKQTVVQYNIDEFVPKRMIVQYTNDQSEDTQVIVNYDDLSVDEKATFDSFKALSESKMQ